MTRWHFPAPSTVGNTASMCLRQRRERCYKEKSRFLAAIAVTLLPISLLACNQGASGDPQPMIQDSPRPPIAEPERTPPQASGALTPPPVMHACNINGCTSAGGTLVLENGHYRNLTTPAGTSDIWGIVNFSADSVVLRRTLSGTNNGSGTFTGHISTRGNTIDDGVLKWDSGAEGHFRAAWGAAIDTVPGGNPALERQQLQSQQHINAPSGQAAVERNLEILTRLAGMVRSDSGGTSKASLNQIEAAWMSANAECRSARSNPRLSESPPSCGRAADLSDELDDARQAFAQESRELAEQEGKLRGACQAGDKPACDKDKVLIHQLNVRNGIPEGPPNTHDILGSFSAAAK
jgi:hypothetical protein